MISFQCNDKTLFRVSPISGSAQWFVWSSRTSWSSWSCLWQPDPLHDWSGHQGHHGSLVPVGQPKEPTQHLVIKTVTTSSLPRWRGSAVVATKTLRSWHQGYSWKQLLFCFSSPLLVHSNIKRMQITSLMAAQVLSNLCSLPKNIQTKIIKPGGCSISI